MEILGLQIQHEGVGQDFVEFGGNGHDAVV
jgi:hypothetical protein